MLENSELGNIMNKEKLKNKWFDLIMKQYYLKEDIAKENNIQKKSLLEIDLQKIDKKLKKVEEQLFSFEEKENKCMNCKYGLDSINSTPCKKCLNGESGYEKKDEEVLLG